ncbi:MAG: hypothetical protein AAF679_14760, partial [Pseudomonadota bacterium]
ADRPRPVHKPSPAWAYGPDAQSFDARWSQQKSTADRAARKAKYQASRGAPTELKRDAPRSPSKAFNGSTSKTIKAKSR